MSSLIASIWIPGEPVAWQRAGRNRITGRTYTPAQTDRWEKHVATCASLYWGRQAPLERPVCMDLFFYFPRPKYAVSKRKAMPVEPHIGRIDWDNLGNAVSDGLEKAGVIVNDRYIVDGRARKYRVVGFGVQPPGVLVLIKVPENLLDE